MIQRFRLSTSRKLAICVGQLLSLTLFLGFLALCIPEGHLLGVALFGISSFCLVRILVLLFVRGDIHEAYVISDHTLAILHPRRKLRMAKIHQVATYYPRIPKLGLNDGTSVGFHCPDLDLKLPELLVRRWYGEACRDDCLAAHAAAARLPDPLYLARTIVQGSLLATAIVSGVSENWPVMVVALAIAFFIALVESTWGNMRSRRFSYPLCEYRKFSDGFQTRRSPKAPPRMLHYLSPYILITLLFALHILPANAYILRRIPPEDGSMLFVAITALFAIPLGGALICRMYKNVLRGYLFATILVSPRTLAVVHPHRPVRYIKRGDCFAFLPGRNRLLLRYGDHVDFTHPVEPRDAAVLVAYLWQYWWPFVPEGNRAGLQVSLNHEDYTMGQDVSMNT